MSNAEHELPSQYNLNSLYRENKDVVDEAYLRNITEGMFGEKTSLPSVELEMEVRLIDPDFEAENREALWKTTDTLIAILGFAQGDYDAKAAVYRGLSFALEAVKHIAPVRVSGFSSEYLDEIKEYDGSLILLKGDVSEYLDASPKLREYIENHTSDIDNTKYAPEDIKAGRATSYAECVKLSAGLVFMNADSELARLYGERRKQIQGE